MVWVMLKSWNYAYISILLFGWDVADALIQGVIFIAIFLRTYNGVCVGGGKSTQNPSNKTSGDNFFYRALNCAYQGLIVAL